MLGLMQAKSSKIEIHIINSNSFPILNFLLTKPNSISRKDERSEYRYFSAWRYICFLPAEKNKEETDAQQQYNKP